MKRWRCAIAPVMLALAIIVVENRPGANSIVGADLVAKAAPDVYTMQTVIAAYAANATLYTGKLPFDTVSRQQMK